MLHFRADVGEGRYEFVAKSCLWKASLTKSPTICALSNLLSADKDKKIIANLFNKEHLCIPFLHSIEI